MLSERQLYSLYDLPRAKESATAREINVDLAIRTLEYAKRFGKSAAVGTVLLYTGQQLSANVQQNKSGEYSISI